MDNPHVIPFPTADELPRCHVCSAYEDTQPEPFREDSSGRRWCEPCWVEASADDDAPIPDLVNAIERLPRLSFVYARKDGA